MLKIITCISVLFTTAAFGSVEVEYANIYANELIDQFDFELAHALPGQQSILESSTYQKLISAREFIEDRSEEALPYTKGSLLLARNPLIYKTVRNQIDSSAKKLEIIKDNNSSRVLYPSVTGAGNVTGNTFPNKVWSLTFDDGPHSNRTQKILDLLIENTMQATFFVLAREVNKHPEAIESILDNGMELALHSYNHLRDLPGQSDATISYEILTAKEEIEQRFNTELSLFRLPYGAGMRNTNLRTHIANYNLIHIFWNVDTLDWKDKDPQSIFERTKAQMNLSRNDAGVILFHDIHAQTVIASELVMKYLNDNSYTTCTVGEVVKFHNNETQYCIK